jgi:hypothetical protein
MSAYQRGRYKNKPSLSVCPTCGKRKWRRSETCWRCRRPEYMKAYSKMWNASRKEREEAKEQTELLDLVDLMFANDAPQIVMDALAQNIHRNITKDTTSANNQPTAT